MALPLLRDGEGQAASRLPSEINTYEGWSALHVRSMASRIWHAAVAEDGLDRAFLRASFFALECHSFWLFEQRTCAYGGQNSLRGFLPSVHAFIRQLQVKMSDTNTT